MQETEIQAEQ